MRRMFAFGFFVIFMITGTVQAQQATTVIVVRHAEKTASPKSDPKLSELGHRRAVVLARMVDELDVAVIFASDYRRTQDTVAPLAQKLALKVNTYDASDSEGLAQSILASHRGEVVLVAGHSNTVPAIVDALGGESKPISEKEYDYMYVVTVVSDGPVITLPFKYLMSGAGHD